MKVAVLSGKGGTGKTTVSASLALSVFSCQYVDCDVEEPNGYIFLKPQIEKSFSVKVKVPKVDDEKCNGCGRCARLCQFNAIAVVKGKVLVFSELCHHCGLCSLACSQKAIYEVEKELGMVETDKLGLFMQGRLNLGESVNHPIIDELKEHMRDDLDVVIDCPPGSSCTVVDSIRDVDYCILVTEPTPFGLHDLKIAVGLVRKLAIPFGVVINKAMENKNIIHDFCKEEGIEILLEIPFSREIAEMYSKGVLPVNENGRWKEKFNQLWAKVKRSAEK